MEEGDRIQIICTQETSFCQNSHMPLNIDDNTQIKMYFYHCQENILQKILAMLASTPISISAMLSMANYISQRVYRSLCP